MLDLFCCQGGAAKGYARAGFELTGVDMSPQRHYPYRFVQADALEYLAEHGRAYDVIHASPPCQAYSQTRHAHKKQHPDLLVPTRLALQKTGRPYVIENVPGAPLINPLILCGASFGLTAKDIDGTRLVLKRHRLFESSLPLMALECEHLSYQDRGYRIGGVYGGGSTTKEKAKVRRGGYTPATSIQAQLMGIDWMTQEGLEQAIPPAYTEFLGHQLRALLMVEEYPADPAQMTIYEALEDLE